MSKSYHYNKRLLTNNTHLESNDSANSNLGGDIVVGCDTGKDPEALILLFFVVMYVTKRKLLRQYVEFFLRWLANSGCVN